MSTHAHLQVWTHVKSCTPSVPFLYSWVPLQTSLPLMHHHPLTFLCIHYWCRDAHCGGLVLCYVLIFFHDTRLVQILGRSLGASIHGLQVVGETCLVSGLSRRGLSRPLTLSVALTLFNLMRQERKRVIGKRNRKHMGDKWLVWNYAIRKTSCSARSVFDARDLTWVVV